MSKLFDAIKREAERVGWPTAWATDLMLDKQLLDKRSPKSFAWQLRENGTHIFLLSNFANIVEPSFTMMDLQASMTHFHGQSLFYIYHKGKLQSFGNNAAAYARAVERIISASVKKEFSRWSTEEEERMWHRLADVKTYIQSLCEYHGHKLVWRPAPDLAFAQAKCSKCGREAFANAIATEMKQQVSGDATIYSCERR